MNGIKRHRDAASHSAPTAGGSEPLVSPMNAKGSHSQPIVQERMREWPDGTRSRRHTQSVHQPLKSGHYLSKCLKGEEA